LTRIVTRSAAILKTAIEAEAAARDRNARGARRRASPNRLLRRLRDWADVEGDGTVTQTIARKGLEREGVDVAGLDNMDRRILTASPAIWARPSA